VGGRELSVSVCVFFDRKDMTTKLTLFLTQVMLVLLLMLSESSLLFGSPHLSPSKC